MRTERPWQPDAYVAISDYVGGRCLRMRPPAHRPRVFKSEMEIVPPVIPEPEVRARPTDPWEIPKAFRMLPRRKCSPPDQADRWATPADCYE